jgi:hypothetical protein
MKIIDPKYHKTMQMQLTLKLNFNLKMKNEELLN